MIQKDGVRRSVKGRLIAPSLAGRDKRQVVHLSNNNRVKTYYVHRLILLAFTGPCPEGMEASHLNGDRYDNRPENLIWEDAKRNCGRRLTHGKFAFGEAVKTSKIKESDVAKIKELGADGRLSQREIGKIFGLSQSQIHRILRGVRWQYAGIDTKELHETLHTEC